MCWSITSTGDSLRRPSKSEQVGYLFAAFIVRCCISWTSWGKATQLFSFPCRHWSGMLRIRGHRCSEGGPEGRSGLLHGSHAHQGDLVLYLNADRCLTLEMRAEYERPRHCYFCRADQSDRSSSVRDDDNHSGADRGPVYPQPGHGCYQGEDRGEEGCL